MTPFKSRSVENRSRSCARLLLTAVVVLSFQTMALAAPPGWNQVWGDEFSGTSLDTTKWDPITWTTPYNNEQQAYLPAQVTVAGGNLALTATNQPFGGKPYRSGKVESKSAQHFGRWEVRAKLPGTQGTWPAIWLLPDTSIYGWPTQGEIDVMENRGNQPTLMSSAYHYGPSVAGHQYVFSENQMNNGGLLENFHSEFHTYAVEWEDSKVRFYVDDVNYYTVHDSQVGNFISNQTAPMEVNLNVAVGGDFLGGAQPNGSSVWPQQMLIDYVRVFEKDANPPPVMLSNGSFEEQGGSLAGWSTFGNTIPNVGTHEDAVLDGEDALKLFGQFTGVTNSSGVSQGITVAAGDEVRADVSRFIRSQDSILGTSNTVTMKIEFFNDFGALSGTAAMLQQSSLLIANGSSPNNLWNDFELLAVAPANAVEARLSLTFRQTSSNGTGAVYVDDVSFVNASLAAAADFNLDGKVNGEDLSAWQAGYGTTTGANRSQGDTDGDGDVDGRDFLSWQNQATPPAALGNVEAVTVPEPATLALLGLTCAGLFLGTRPRN